jgi:hypothetical protein
LVFYPAHFIITFTLFDTKSPNFSLSNNSRFNSNEPNNNFSFNEDQLDEEGHSFHSFDQNQPASIEILDGEELDMSRVGEPPLETMADFARLLAGSQLSSSGGEEETEGEKEEKVVSFFLRFGD